MSLKKKLLCSVAVAAVAIPLSITNIATSAQAGESCYTSGNSIYCSSGFSGYSSGNSFYGNDGYSSYSSGNSTYGTAVVGTVSGTSISFGTPSVYAEYYTSAQFAVFDSAANQTVICTGGTTGTLNAFAASISGTSVSFSSGTLVSGSTSTYGNLAYDSTNSKIIISYTDSTNSSYGTSNILSLSPAFTIGTDYYVQSDGTLSTTVSSVPAGRPLSTTSILLEG